MSREQLERALLIGIKAGLWIVPLLLLYIPSAWPFPYITGRNFAFRIIVEIAVVLWAALICYNPQYRPRVTPLLKAASVFLAVVFLADLLSPNPQRALLSDYEKMEGFIGLAHFYFYFLLLASVFRSGRDWTIFFTIAIATSVVVSLGAILQKIGVGLPFPDGELRVYSTVGNASYLASYMLLSVWLVGLFFARYGLHIRYAAALLCALSLNVVAIYLTATRSALLGLVVCVAFALVSAASFAPVEGGRRVFVKRWITVFCAATALLVLAVWLLRDVSFIQGNIILERLTNYAFSYTGKDTISTRLMLWKIAWQGIAERPLLGWGQENFYLVFQEHFNPGLYGKESWFDRAHNMVLDWALHAGLLGLVAYGALWGAALQTLYRKVRDGRIPFWQGLFVGAFFASYFVNNQFQFDTFNTYFLYFALLAFVATAGDIDGEMPALSGFFSGQTQRGAAAALASVLIALSLYFFTVKPMLQARASMRALSLGERAMSSNSIAIDEVISAFGWALSYDGMGVSQVREDVGSLVHLVVSSPRWRREEKMRYVAFALSELRKDAGAPAKNIKHLLMVAEVLYSARFLDPAFAGESLKMLREAAELSPRRQLIYVEMARVYLYGNNYDAALEWLRKAWDLDRSFTGVAADIIAVALAADRAGVAEEVEHNIPLRKWRPRDLKQIGDSQRQRGDFSAALRYYARLVELEPGVAEFHLLCGIAHLNLGEVDAARAFFIEAVRLDADGQTEAQKYLQRIKAKGL